MNFTRPRVTQGCSAGEQADRRAMNQSTACAKELMIAQSKHPERYLAVQDIGSLARVLNVTPDNTPLYVKPGTSKKGKDQVTTEPGGKFASKCAYTPQEGAEAFKVLVAGYGEKYGGNTDPKVINAIKIITDLFGTLERGQPVLSHQVRHAVNVLHDATPISMASQERLVTLEESAST